MSVYSHKFSLYKRPTGYYPIGYYRDGVRRWKSTGTTTKREALAFLSRFREVTQERARSVSLEQFIKEFLDYSQGNHSTKTVTLFRAILARFSSLFPHAALKEITPEHIDRFKTKRLREVKPASVNIELRMLKSAFSTARRWKLIDANPLDGVSMAHVPEQAPVFFKAAEFQRFIECLKEGWLREVVLFAVLTGMRKGEILNLRWTDVDLSRRVVNVQSNASFKTKQGRRRTVPLNDSAFYLLTQKQGKSASEHVFILDDNPINPAWVTVDLGRAPHYLASTIRSRGET